MACLSVYLANLTIDWQPRPVDVHSGGMDYGHAQAHTLDEGPRKKFQSILSLDHQ